MQRLIQKTYKNLKKEYNRDRSRFAMRVTIVLLAVTILLIKRSIWTPDTLLIGIVIIGVIFGRTRDFIVRFVPFLGLLVIYDSMRGFADDLNKNTHFTEMISFDRWLSHGTLPTVWLQQQLHHSGVQWYDFYFYFLYTIHFLAPVIIGLILWRYRPRLYWPFVWTVVGVSFVAFVVYILFPAAPPWLAKEMGYISEPLQRLSSNVWYAMGVTDYSAIYKNISPNEVAAVPSLHSAYPLIAAIYIIMAFGFKRVWWIMIYPLSMWLGVVYLGEHYVFDVLCAIILVVVSVIAVNQGFRVYRRNHPTHWWQRLPFLRPKI
jgi:hypothetical protein